MKCKDTNTCTNTQNQFIKVFDIVAFNQIYKEKEEEQMPKALQYFQHWLSEACVHRESTYCLTEPQLMAHHINVYTSNVQRLECLCVYVYLVHMYTNFITSYNHLVLCGIYATKYQQIYQDISNDKIPHQNKHKQQPSNIGPEIQTTQNKNTRIADPSFAKKAFSKVINSSNECTFPSIENNDLNDGFAFREIIFYSYAVDMQTRW